MEAPTPLDSHTRSRTALVVEDERNIRRMLAECLAPSGFDVTTVGSGEEALERLESGTFDVMLLDLRLPGIDGMEVLRRTRVLQPELPVIVITAFAKVETSVEAFRLGVRDLVEKPFTPDEIRAHLKRVVDGLGTREAPERYDELVAGARASIRDGRFAHAESALRRAVAILPSRPEGLHLLGVVAHARGERDRAEDFFRAALGLAPAYGPARENLVRTGGFAARRGRVVLLLGDEESGEKR